MYGKLLIKAELRVLTGLHIGASGATAAIGAITGPVICDPRTHHPVVPGSSLKGKLRTLLARSLAGNVTRLPNFARDDITIRRLFGCHDPFLHARLQFADGFVCNAEEFKEIGLTEAKFENVINRATSAAQPRQIERVVPGVRFRLRIGYDAVVPEEVLEDMKTLAHGMKLLQLDYLGGHGTRGSGRVSFEGIRVDPMEASFPQAEIDRLNELFKDVEAYDLFTH